MIEKLFEIQEILLNQFKQENFYYSRDLLSHIGLNNKITGIVGAPGVGKTTFLLKQTLLANEERQRALYLSADHLFFDMRLLDLVDTLYKETEVRLLCIDEIHKYPNWAQEMIDVPTNTGSHRWQCHSQPGLGGGHQTVQAHGCELASDSCFGSTDICWHWNPMGI